MVIFFYVSNCLGMLFCTIVNFERQDRSFFFVDKGGEEKKIEESKAQQQLMCVESEISDRNCVFFMILNPIRPHLRSQHRTITQELSLRSSRPLRDGEKTH